MAKKENILDYCKLLPAPGYVVIKPEDTGVTASGLLVPESDEKERIVRGMVVAVGERLITLYGAEIPKRYNRSDNVYYMSFSAYDLRFNDKILHVVKGENVVLTIDG